MAKEVDAKGEPVIDNGFGNKRVRTSRFRLECGRQNLLTKRAYKGKESLKIIQNTNSKIMTIENETS